MMKQLFFLSAAGSFVDAAYFACGAGTTMNFTAFSKQTVNAATCCETKPVFVAKCNQISESTERIFFDCNDVTKTIPQANYFLNASAANCCVTTARTCSKASGTAQSLLIKYQCPTGKSYNESKWDAVASEANCCSPATCKRAILEDGRTTNYKCPTGKYYNESKEDELASEANCCATLVPNCKRVSSGCPIKYPGSNECLDLFPCATGTILNTTGSNLEQTSPDQAKCCEPFTPTCQFNTGDVLNQKKFLCAAGLRYNVSAEKANSSEASCCEAYNTTCSMANDIGDHFTCSSGTVRNGSAAELTSPSQEICCKNATCSDAFQATCASMLNSPCTAQSRRMVDPARASSSFNEGRPETCCKQIPIVATEFSGASMIGPGSLAIALLIRAILFL